MCEAQMREKGSWTSDLKQTGSQPFGFMCQLEEIFEFWHMLYFDELLVEL